MPESTPSDPKPIQMEIHQSKSAFFRVVHADGVWSGVNPWGDLHLAFYNERAPIPQKLLWEYDDTSKSWKEVGREGKGGWFREVEVDIVLSRESAQHLLSAIQYYLNPSIEQPSTPVRKEK